MIINIDDIAKLVGVLSIVGGVWMTLRRDIDQNRRDLDAYKLHVAETYASQEGMTKALKPLFDELHALRSRIDKFMDRP